MNLLKVIGLAVAAVAVLPLLGCSSGADDDLRQWVANERAQAKPRVTPLSEPKQFQPALYTAESGTEPFDPRKLTQALRRDSDQVASNAALIAPELARRKDHLESFPLDTMIMVGSLQKAGHATALLKVDALLYQVRVGAYLGQNYGRITEITDNGIQLREIVQDATGDWIERNASLALQEGDKK